MPVAICLIKFGAHQNISFIIKLSIQYCALKGVIQVPVTMLTTEFRMVDIFLTCKSLFSKQVFLGVHFSHVNGMPLGCRGYCYVGLTHVYLIEHKMGDFPCTPLFLI